MKLALDYVGKFIHICSHVRYYYQIYNLFIDLMFSRQMKINDVVCIYELTLLAWKQI